MQLSAYRFYSTFLRSLMWTTPHRLCSSSIIGTRENAFGVSSITFPMSRKLALKVKKLNSVDIKSYAHFTYSSGVRSAGKYGKPFMSNNTSYIDIESP